MGYLYFYCYMSEMTGLYSLTGEKERWFENVASSDDRKKVGHL